MREIGMGQDDIELILVEPFPCQNKDQAKARERFWIERDGLLNSSIPTRTDKEYRDANKTRMSAWSKQYYVENKQKINDRNNLNYQRSKVAILGKHKLLRKQNPDIFRERSKKYDANNREKILTRLRTKANCPHCGVEINKSSMSRHTKRVHSNDKSYKGTLSS
jgi:predicted RNA-binding Zn-ribbon protein involved in translation (DUF1610 family)